MLILRGYCNPNAAEFGDILITAALYLFYTFLMKSWALTRSFSSWNSTTWLLLEEHTQNASLNSIPASLYSSFTLNTLIIGQLKFHYNCVFSLCSPFDFFYSVLFAILLVGRGMLQNLYYYFLELEFESIRILCYI